MQHGQKESWQRRVSAVRTRGLLWLSKEDRSQRHLARRLAPILKRSQGTVEKNLSRFFSASWTPTIERSREFLDAVDRICSTADEINMPVRPEPPENDGLAGPEEEAARDVQALLEADLARRTEIERSDPITALRSSRSLFARAVLPQPEAFRFCNNMLSFYARRLAAVSAEGLSAALSLELLATVAHRVDRLEHVALASLPEKAAEPVARDQIRYWAGQARCRAALIDHDCARNSAEVGRRLRQSMAVLAAAAAPDLTLPEDEMLGVKETVDGPASVKRDMILDGVLGLANELLRRGAPGAEACSDLTADAARAWPASHLRIAWSERNLTALSADWINRAPDLLEVLS